MSLRLIINADDLGRTPEVNHAIARLLSRGLITSATVIANAPYVEEGVALIPPPFRDRLGIHLNITEFRPLTGEEVWRGWLAEGGCFSLENFRQKPLSPQVKRAIWGEWCAQVARLRSLGLKLSHLDSHHDVHTDPRLLMVLKRLQKHTGLNKMRLPETLPIRPGALLLKNRLWSWVLRYWPPRARSSQAFASFVSFWVRGRQGPLPYHTLEVMVHPGHANYAEETALLESPWRETLPFPVELISYQEL
uniref:ChbG/HpnK family deacetylase n=1 Tax=Desulfobacca acetoxidans TaxID=60893 RepID=A0A7C5EQP9_9BACT